VEIDLSVQGRPGPDRQAKLEEYADGTTPLRIGTDLVLTRPSGEPIVFASDVRSKLNVRKVGDGAYEVGLHFEPETSIVGHDIEDLQEIRSLGVRLGGVLSAAGLDPASLTISSFTLRVNGLPLVQTTLGRLSAGISAEYEQLAVADYFRDIHAKYKKAHS
jgi:hypothetical protein